MIFEFTLGIQEIEKQNVKINHRKAVRAIIIKSSNILMVNSNKGDYKFPGGGVKAGESDEEALIREVREEIGYIIDKVKEKVGMVIERNTDGQEDGSIFEMASYYYLCEVSENQVLQELDDYEADLDFSPEWINIDIAININEDILRNEDTSINHWVRRETAVLRELKRIIPHKYWAVQS